MQNIIEFATAFGIASGILMTFFVLLIAIYVYCAFALMTIAKKLNTKNAWMAWIPVLNYYYLTKISRVSPLWTLSLLACLIPFAPWLGWFMVGVMIWMFWRIAEMRKLPGWISLLLIVPLLNFVILGIIAWYK
ncbi:MAG: hypothetical protein N3D20_02275 [Candidatus Pacearchaeota archaeon]|nr:hypothetical protein [Candidatus Pacearchaeota archaeon]